MGCMSTLLFSRLRRLALCCSANCDFSGPVEQQQHATALSSAAQRTRGRGGAEPPESLERGGAMCQSSLRTLAAR
eukprot:15480761-Alexandrium_andersonii.AAC.1